MKEIITKAGGKHVYSTTVDDAQHEVLEPLQAFFEKYGACIIQGCEVTVAHTTGGVPDQWNIAAGIVALNHADGFKICRYAGDTGVVFSSELYLSVTKTPVTGNYNTGPDDAAYIYEAVLNTGSVPTPGDPLYLKLNSTANQTLTTQFADAFATQVVTGWQSLTLEVGVSGALKCAINKAARLLYIQGTITISSITGNGIVKQCLTIPAGGAIVWPVGFVPATKQYFKAFRDYDPSNPSTYILEQAAYDHLNDADCYADNNGITVFARKPVSASTLTVNINCVLQLD